MGVNLFGKIAHSLSVQEDFIRIATSFIFNIILSYGLRFMSHPRTRGLYSALLGPLFLYIMLEEWALYVIITGVISFLIISQLRKSHLFASVVIGFSFLLFVHFYRSIFDYESWKLDCSVMQMFMTTKIVYYGYYLENGGKPNFFNFLSYSLFFSNVLIGPTVPYETFQKFINLEGHYSNINYNTQQVTFNIFKGIIFSILTVLLVPRFPPDWSVESEWVRNSSLLTKIFIMNVIGIVYRIKFYTGWSFTQAAIDMSGLSYDEQGKFTQAQCGSFLYEIHYNPRVKTEYWNSSVQKWLKICFYEPLTKKFPKNPTLATFGVFFFSALWHGIYITYYLGFIQWALIANISKYFYKASWKFGSLQGTTFLKIITWIVSNTFLNYFGMLVVILNFWKGMQYYNSLYWFGTIAIVATQLFFDVTRWGQKPPTKQVKKE